MQHVQRQFGKLLPRTANESQVGLLIKDFDHAVDLLGLFIRSTKAWQQSWKDILDSQARLAAGFVAATTPIPGSSDDSYNGPVPLETPPAVARRLARFHQENQALREELEPDLRLIESQIVGPAQQAKDLTHSMKKTIKTRENCKLDFERHQSRRDAIFKKVNRSDKDNLALSRHDSDLQVAKDTYESADIALRDALPGLLNALYSLIPSLLTVLIRIANTLVANYYTTIHEFCQAERFSVPSPPISEVVSHWAESCKPAQSQIESLASCTNAKRGRVGGIGAASPRVASGNVSTTSISPSISPSRDDNSSSIHSQNQIRRVHSTHIQQGQALLSPGFRPPRSSNSTDFSVPISAASRPDHFSQERIPSASLVTSTASSAALLIVGKKKPPPPPPKRIGSSKSELWVTALYDFGGQNQGDLQMREGDRIKVLKKTESTNDWWEGECNGMRGSFPANYCQT